MCEKAVKKYLCLLKYVPDWFVTDQQIKIWHDNDYHCNDDQLIEWHKGYQKLKTQKAKIKEELLPIAWHPSRYWDWCTSKDEKKETEKLWALAWAFKSQEFSIKDIEVFVDSEEQNWFKRAHVRKFLGLENIRTSLNDLDKCEMLIRPELVPTRRSTSPWPGPKDQQNKTEKFLSAFGVMQVIVNSKKDKVKALKEHILKDLVSRGLDARIEEIQEKHRLAIE